MKLSEKRLFEIANKITTRHYYRKEISVKVALIFHIKITYKTMIIM